MANHGFSLLSRNLISKSDKHVKLGNAMKNFVKVGMIVVLAILISSYLSAAFAGNDKVSPPMTANTTNTTITNATKTITLQNTTNETKNVISVNINLTNVTMKPKNVTNSTINITTNTIDTTKKPINETKNATNVTINLTNMTIKPKHVTNSTINIKTNTINMTNNTTNEGAKIESEVHQQVMEMQKDTKNISSDNANEIKSALKNSY